MEGFKSKMGVTREYFRIPEKMVLSATIQGHLPVEDLKEVIHKATMIHPLLGVRVEVDDDQEAWFTTQGCADPILKVLARNGNEQWMGVVEEEYQEPFNFQEGPLIRYILLQSPEVSDLIIICQHSIGDGISLLNLLQDLLQLLEQQELEKVPPVLFQSRNLPAPTLALKLRLLVDKFFIDRINRRWNKNQVLFTNQDYLDLHKSYSQRYRGRILAKVLEKEETSSLLSACRREGVTVNSALSVAFLSARQRVEGEDRTSVNIPLELRSQLRKPKYDFFGFMVGSLNLEFDYQSGEGFWDNVQRFHQEMLIEKKEDPIQHLKLAEYTSPTLNEAINFAIYGQWMTPDCESYPKLSSFLESQNLAPEMARERMNHLSNVLMSNMGWLKPRQEYKKFKLKRLHLAILTYPFLAFGVAVVTLEGRLSLTLNYTESREGPGRSSTMKRILDESLEILNRAV